MARRPAHQSAVTRMRVSVHRAEVLEDIGYLPPGHCLLREDELPEHDDVDREDGLPRCMYWHAFWRRRHG